jgi:hypothetical protein
MKVEIPKGDHVQVTVKHMKRDPKTMKMKPEIFETFKVFEASPEQVYRIAFDAIKKA